MYSLVFDLHADLLKALAHPRRLEIINLLRHQELPVTDIHTMLDLPQANISQHLMVLREAQIVSTRRNGKQIYYSVTDPRIVEASDLLRDYLSDSHTEIGSQKELKLSMKDLVPIVHDPVCGMRISPKTAGFSSYFGDKTYYFCASGCFKEFEKHPKKYA